VTLAIAGRDVVTALWLGLGWAAIEVLYAIANGLALSALVERTDPEAQRIRATIPPSLLTGGAVAWGVLERVWASAVHIGFTLVLAAVPIAALVTAPAHTLVNVAFTRALRRYPMAMVMAAGLALGAAILAVGWVLVGA
jgi:hypothetical protein